MPRRRSGGAKAGGQGRGRKELDSDSITTPEEAGSPDSDDVGVYACDQPGAKNSETTSHLPLVRVQLWFPLDRVRRVRALANW